MLKSARVEFRSATGALAGYLEVRCRPGKYDFGGDPLILGPDSDVAQTTGASLVLLEDAEYLYQLDVGSADDPPHLEPSELFDSDDEMGRTGRLRPGSTVGGVEVELTHGDTVASASIEVRSRKLGYLADYRWMLSGIAAEAAELVMHRFAPAQLDKFVPDVVESPRTLYQRFVVLESLLRSETVLAALETVLRAPDHTYQAAEERRAPNRGARGGAAFIRQLSGTGRRIPHATIAGGVPIPEVVVHRQFDPSRDTEPNQFVKFALSTWRATCERVHQGLERARRPAELRGARRAAALLAEIEGYLESPSLRGVSELRHFPSSNQVLQKRAGYRELFAAYLVSEAGARLRWDEQDESYSASQWDVATLYEYWAYLQLRRILSRLCGESLDVAELFEVRDSELVFLLRRGRARVLRGATVRRGRELVVELWFNRRFSTPAAAWSRAMQPDCSVLVTATPGYGGNAVHTWLHFDAKYKIDSLVQALGTAVAASAEGEAVDPDSASESTGRVLREDLLKMHAYRDAIRRTAGAYVLYPGRSRESDAIRQYHEILPGIGAFALRPDATGAADASQAGALASFLEDTLAHVANQASQRERAGFWASVAYESPVSEPVHASPELLQPPADTKVLLGYVRNSAQLQWIHLAKLYNVRADERTGSVAPDGDVVASPFLLLYGPEIDAAELWLRTGVPRVMTGEQLRSLGYPHPRGRLYCCLELSQRLRPEETRLFTVEHVLRIRAQGWPNAPYGAPVTVSWQALFGRDPAH